MSIERVVRRFQRCRPTDEVTAMICCKVALRHVGSGSYRNVYQVDDLDLVAKFPNEEGPYHSVDEINVLRRLQRGKKLYADLQQYLPVVHYANKDTGVILMKKYEMVKNKNRKLFRNLDQLGETFGEAFGVHDWDYHEWNFGVSEAGGLVLLDFGCLAK